MNTHQRTTTRRAAASVLAVAALGLAGCGNGESETGTDIEDVQESEVLESSPAPQEAGETPADTIAPYSGAYNRDFYDDQALYEGQEVTLTGEVEDVVSPNALQLSDPNDVELGSLLVLHDADLPELQDGALVEVTGTLQASLDVAAAEEDLGADLGDELADMEGESYVRATEVTVTQQEE
ncbi:MULTISPECIES: hypothetical protein [Kocuria]|uniref:DUF5666 domain-containing protein n=1 Tax=Kocuria oceani TaxID=988827 RepID=A0ABV9TGY7_9MICC|nr:MULTISPECIES: hypothetical protein [Kocuria]KLU11500.1 hypothetical protein ABL57_01395 [Kocuria sp. SM24M-10]OLT08130.1 hypothetical protein BJF77_02210 [Kocuria sp. CNJ-770]